MRWLAIVIWCPYITKAGMEDAVTCGTTLRVTSASGQPLPHSFELGAFGYLMIYRLCGSATDWTAVVFAARARVPTGQAIGCTRPSKVFDGCGPVGRVERS